MTIARTPTISLTEDQRAALELKQCAPTLNRAAMRRSAIILLSADGVSADEIAKVVQVAHSAVYGWRGRFLRFGPDALFKPRKPHTSRRYGPEIIQQIRTIIAGPPPDRQRWWTAKRIATRITGVKHQYISELIRRMGIDLRAGRRRVYPY